MAAMTTALTETFSNNGNVRTYRTAAHTSLDRELVLQRSDGASSGSTMLVDKVSVVETAHDSNGDILPQMVVFTVEVRRNKHTVAADVDAGLALFREFIAADEFEAVVDNQDPIA